MSFVPSLNILESAVEDIENTSERFVGIHNDFEGKRTLKSRTGTTALIATTTGLRRPLYTYIPNRSDTTEASGRTGYMGINGAQQGGIGDMGGMGGRVGGLKRLSLVSKSKGDNPTISPTDFISPKETSCTIPSTASVQSESTYGDGDEPGRDLGNAKERGQDVRVQGSQAGLSALSTPRRSTSIRRSGGGGRSSISYSPAVHSSTMSTSANDQSLDQRVDENHRKAVEPTHRRFGSLHQASCASGGSGMVEGEEERRRKRRGETLVEKHGELLTLIAQKERRVNELKEELASQESTLLTLKQRWTTLISRQTPTSQPQISRIRHSSSSSSSSSHPLSSKHRSQSSTPTANSSRVTAHSSSASSSSTSTLPSLSVSSSTSSDLSSHSSLSSETAPELISFDKSIAALFSTIPISSTLPALSNLPALPAGTAEKILSGEAIEGGKRFWDNLVKTVSAAASGTVPDGLVPWYIPEEEEEGEEGSGDVRSRAQREGRVSRSRVSGGKVGPARPANASRLSGSDTKRRGDGTGTAGGCDPSPMINISEDPALLGGRGRQDEECSHAPQSKTASAFGLDDLLSDNDGLAGKALTPQRLGIKRGGTTHDQVKVAQGGKKERKMEDAEESDGWGW